jgi:diacylglycerol kinase family enzyme
MRDPGTRARVLERLGAALTTRDGEPPTIVVPEVATDLGPHVRRALETGVPSVVAVGGDGTLKDVVAELQGSQVPLGIVPSGTGNVLAGVLGVPRDPATAADALPTARVRQLDLGEVRLEPADGGVARTQPFLVGCGIGFDARVMAATPSGLKQRFGKAAYFATGGWLAARIATVPYRVTVDDQVFEVDGSIAMALNMGELIPGVLGPRLPVVPDDGLLDVVVLGARNPLHGLRGLLHHLRRTWLGHDAATQTLRVRGRTIRLESNPAEPAQIDGDHFDPAALEASVRPGALQVLVPAASDRW